MCVCVQEVEGGPSWLFQDLSSHLSPLFKSTYSLIKVSPFHHTLFITVTCSGLSVQVATELLDKLSYDQETFKTGLTSFVSRFDYDIHYLII